METLEFAVELRKIEEKNDVMKNLHVMFQMKSEKQSVVRGCFFRMSCEICEDFKNTFSYRAPLVAASEIKKVFNFQRFLL